MLLLATGVLVAAAALPPVAERQATTLSANALKPVILYHGLNSDATMMDTIASVIEADHPGTVATSLPLFEGAVGSVSPLQDQISGVAAAIRQLVANDTALYSKGYNLVCHSQGAAVCRMAISEMDDHAVETFVSLAGAQMGCYGADFLTNAYNAAGGAATGDPALDVLVDQLVASGGAALTEHAWQLSYETELKHRLSLAQLWRDPRHLVEYYAHSPVLPRHTENATRRHRDNLVRLPRAVFTVGSTPMGGALFEGGIEPWQTAIFGADDGSGTIVPLEAHDWYAKDTLGLRALNEAGNLTLTVVPGASHKAWTTDEDLIRAQVLPWLA